MVALLSKAQGSEPRGRGRPAKADGAADQKRVQVFFPIAYYENLEALKERTDAASIAEVLKAAVKFYAFGVDALQSGNEVLLRDAKSGKETRLLF